MRFIPVRADAGIDLQRHSQVGRCAHQPHYFVAHRLCVFFGNLEYQFVVHLHDHSRLYAIILNPVMNGVRPQKKPRSVTSRKHPGFQIRNRLGVTVLHACLAIQSLCGLILVVDVRRLLSDYDKQMLSFAESVDLPVHVLLTKADKLKRGQASSALLQVQKELDGKEGVQLFSALKRQGVEEARKVLQDFLAQ